MRITTVSLALLLLAVDARAAVVAAEQGGFIIRQELEIDAPRAAVFTRLVQIASWWSAAHTFSGSAANLSIDARAGGCWCEKLPSGGSVRHGSVEYVEPNKLLRFSGTLGPLQSMSSNGVLTFELTGEKPTKLVLTNVVSGFAPGQGFAAIAPAVDGVLAEQLQRLKRAVETGKP